jgi:hypothetical protein
MHLEAARRNIEKNYQVKTRFVGSYELAEEVQKLPRDRIEELMGFTVREGGGESGAESRGADVLASVSASHLEGLHLLAAISYPVPPLARAWPLVSQGLRARGHCC